MALEIAGIQSLGYSNLGAKDMIEDFLKDKIGIEADISVGVLGTGLLDSSNSYKDLRNGGKSISHSDVLARIKAYTG